MLPVMQPLTSKELFKASFRGYSKSFSHVIWILLGYIAFVLVSNAIHAYLLWILDDGLTFQYHADWFTFATIWTIVLLAFFHAFVGVWLHLLMFLRVNSVLTQSLYPKRVLFETSLRQFLPYFAASFILFCAVSIGLLLFVLPGIFIWLSFMLVKPIIATENLKLTTAFCKSWQLIKCHRLHVLRSGFWVMLVGVVVAFFMVGSVGAIFYLLDIMISRGDVSEVCMSVGAFVLTYTAFALLLPLYYSFLSVLLQDLKARVNSTSEKVVSD